MRWNDSQKLGVSVYEKNYQWNPRRCFGCNPLSYLHGLRRLQGYRDAHGIHHRCANHKTCRYRSDHKRNQNQNPNNQSSYENSAPGGDAVIQGEQAAMFAALDYSGYDKVVDSQILVENGQEPYYKVTAEDFDTGDVNTYYVYGDGSVVPAGD